MSGQYIVYHCHSMLSNSAGIDSVTPFEDYVKRAKECGMIALGISEHGNVFNWVHKKEVIEAAGLKFLFEVEVYLTKSLDEKKRDNYHCILIARNQAGQEEICELLSHANNKDDGHFYFSPRITFDELFHTTDNVIITTACVAGPLCKGTESAKTKFLEFCIKHSDRVFLEVQHHPKAEKQKEYNRYLTELSHQYNIPLIAATDTHCLNKEHEAGRAILQRAKNVHFEGEDDWDLTWKTYDELVAAFKEQGALSEEDYMTAIENTNRMADMIEPWSIDRSIKYPRIYPDAEAEFKRQINQGYRNNKYLHERYDKATVKKRVLEEFEVYKKLNAFDFMLLETHILNWERKHNIKRGYGRGSVSGSLIAYILGITEMDSLKFDLNFFRFLNPARVTNSDIDVDYGLKDRDKVKQYLLKDHLNVDNVHTSEIITFNTIAMKGAIKDIGRALMMPLNEVQKISNAVSMDENKNWVIDDKWRKQYPELFKYVDIVSGVVVSFGTHPSGVLVTDFDIGKKYATCHLSTSDYPVVQLDMHELDGLMLTKLDCLGLDTIGVINKTCDYLGIERLGPDNVNLDDEDVWKSIRANGLAVFQWESNSAQVYLKKFMSDKVIEIAKAHDPDFSYIKWFSFGNGLLRPGCASFRDSVADGIYYDNGLPELNDFLNKEAGHIVMQETIMKWLVKFCGYTEAESDNVRRSVAKKKGTKQLLPEIEKRFIEYTSVHYNVTKEKCAEVIKPFLQSILDASSYAFSWNHSDSYSCIGYVAGYLRYYCPLEFLTASLNVFEGNEEKTLALTTYAQQRGIQVIGIRFRYSRDEYTYDKKTHSIYKGMSSIKYLNKRLSREIYKLRDNHYDSFVDLLIDINTKTSTDSRQLDILIKLDFFNEFGTPNELLREVEIFNKYNGAKQLSKSNVDGLIPHDTMLTLCRKETEKKYIDVDWYGIVKYLVTQNQIESTPISQLAKWQGEHLGYISLIVPKLASTYHYVLDSTPKYNNHILTLYCLHDGTQQQVKVRGKTWDKEPINKGDIIHIIDMRDEGRWSKDDAGQWQQSTTEFESILKKYAIVK